MIYRNNDPMAILAMEEARTGNYGGDGETEFIGVCDACDSTIYDDDSYYEAQSWNMYDCGEKILICGDCMDRLLKGEERER